MNGEDSMRSVVVERHLAHPPERVWRALTQPHLLEAWLMKAAFEPVAGHRFQFEAEWGTIDGEVLEARPHEMLAYSWGDAHLKSVVTWTLIPIGTGTRLRMEQVGFQPGQGRYYGGARAGWPRLFDALERVLDEAG